MSVNSICWRVLTICFLLSFPLACAVEEKGNPDYISIYPLYSDYSKSHPFKSTRVDLRTDYYYSKDEKLLNLKHFRIKSADEDRDQNGKPAISINLNGKGGQILSEYTSKHMGEMLGIFLDGHLVATPVIRAEIKNAILICGDFTEHQVERHVATIKNYGEVTTDKKMFDLMSECLGLKEEIDNLVALNEYLDSIGKEEEIKAKQKRIEKLDKIINRGLKLKDKMESSRQEVFRLRDNMRLASEVLGNRPNVDLLVKSMENLASQSGLRVEKFQPLPERKKGFYGEIPINMKMFGGYHELGFFFEKISSEARIMNVTDLSIHEVNNKNNSISASFTLTVFWYLSQ
jgi:Tfp pilus assembly protein PilO